MVQKRTCDYSGQDIEPGTGTMFVKTDGTVLYFADSKCEKNYLLGREPRDLEWIKDDQEFQPTASAAEELQEEPTSDVAEDESVTDDSAETPVESDDENTEADEDESPAVDETATDDETDEVVDEEPEEETEV